MSERKYVESDIGEEIEMNIDGVTFFDEIVEVCLPDGKTIIGPKFVCGQIFARFTMLDNMMAASEIVKNVMADIESTINDETQESE